MITESLATFLKETGCDQKKFLTSEQWRKLALKLLEQFEELFNWEQSIVTIDQDGEVTMTVTEPGVGFYPFIEQSEIPDGLRMVAFLELADLSEPDSSKFGFESDEDCNSFAGKVLRITVVTANGDSLIAEREMSTGRYRFSNFAIGIEPALLAKKLGVELRLSQKRMAFGMLTVPCLASDPTYTQQLGVTRKLIVWLLKHPTFVDLLPAYYEDRADEFMRDVQDMPVTFSSNAAASVMLSASPYLREAEIYEEIKLATRSAKKAKAVMSLINRTFN